MTASLVILVLVLAGAAYWLDLGDRLGLSADPDEDPAAVAPPVGLELPEPADADPVAAALGGGQLRAQAVRRSLASLSSDRRLGRRVGVVVGTVDGTPVHREGPGVVVPASTLKILTSLAALESLGPEHRFRTSAVVRGRRLTLVGGGDPMLVRDGSDYDDQPTRTDLTTLARRTARALTAQGQTRVRLGYDDTLFTGPTSSPHWEDDYLPDDVVSPITALWVDEGRVAPGDVDRSDNPSGDAASAFAAALRTRGITVLGPPEPVQPPVDATEVASVDSAELVEIVHHVLEASDNEAAEVLAHHVALAEGHPGSFAGATAAVREVVERLGVDMRGAVVHDGSGLARSNRLRLGSLLDALALAADPDRPRLSGVLQGLPVAGFTGSLTYRFAVRADEGLGRVRAKTGTLTGVHGLAGVVTGRDGSVMTFAAVADRVRVPNTLFARDRLDQMAAALADCACAAR